MQTDMVGDIQVGDKVLFMDVCLMAPRGRQQTLGYAVGTITRVQGDIVTLVDITGVEKVDYAAKVIKVG